MTNLSWPKCDKCGTPMEIIKAESTSGLHCPKCGWSVVTTYIPEFRRDTTKYEVRVQGGDFRNSKHIEAVAKVTGGNFIASRKLLQEMEPMVYTGKATEVVRVRQILAEAGMGCTISPEFRW